MYILLKGPDGLPETHLAPLMEEASWASFPVSRDRFILAVSTVPFTDSVYTVPLGKASPELYIYRASVKLLDESASIVPQLRKEYCGLEVSITSQHPLPELCVRGNWNGQKADGSLLAGPFRASLKSGEQVNIPRQGDNSLMLDVMNSSGSVLRSFAIGEYMSEAGYDWTEGSLQDLSLKVDYVNNAITLNGRAWSYTFPIKIEL